MESLECKIPKWKKKKNEIQKQSFDDAFESLGTRQEFHKAKEEKETIKDVAKEKVTP